MSRKHYLELAIVGEYDEIILEGAGAAVLPGEVHQLIVLIQGHQALPLVRRYLYTIIFTFIYYQEYRVLC
jgi:hypothetical protein